MNSVYLKMDSVYLENGLLFFTFYGFFSFTLDAFLQIKTLFKPKETREFPFKDQKFPFIEDPGLCLSELSCSSSVSDLSDVSGVSDVSDLSDFENFHEFSKLKKRKRT